MTFVLSRCTREYISLTIQVRRDRRVRALVQELRRGGFLNILGGIFACHDRALHEALLIGQMLACNASKKVFWKGSFALVL